MKKSTSLKKGMRMNMKRFARRLAVAAGFFFLCAVREPAQGQGITPSSAPTPPKGAPVARPQRAASTLDDFAGLEFTAEQKAKMAQIHQDMKSRMDFVVKDEKLDADQRNAMLEGYGRMERSQVFKVLTPEQQKEVLERIRARRVEQQQEKKQHHSPPR